MSGQWGRFRAPKPQHTDTSGPVGSDSGPDVQDAAQRQPWRLGDARVLLGVLPQPEETLLRIRLPAADGEGGVREAVLHEVEQTADEDGNPVIVLHAVYAAEASN